MYSRSPPGSRTSRGGGVSPSRTSLPSIATSRTTGVARRTTPSSRENQRSRSPAASTSRYGGGASSRAGGGAASSRFSRTGMSSTVRSRSPPGRSTRGGLSRGENEKLMKRTAKKMRDLVRLEAKDRQTFEAESDAFYEVIDTQFDEEREQLLQRTIVRLNKEVGNLQHTLRHTEYTWRAKWKKLATEAGKMSEMLSNEGMLPVVQAQDDAKANAGGGAAAASGTDDEEQRKLLLQQQQEQQGQAVFQMLASAEDGSNYAELADKVASFTKLGQDSIVNLKREKLNEKLRGDDFQMRLQNKSAELDAADRLIRTHLVGRGSEATIAVELFRKQGLDFERRFAALDNEFRARVDQLLVDSASVEMVGVHNREDAIIAKLKLNRELDHPSSHAAAAAGGINSTIASTATAPARSLTEENARRVEDSRAWRPSGKNYVDILEQFITSSECQKILQVQLLRDIQLAMIELSRKHFVNITSEIRRNRSNLPASVRSKLFNDSITTRDDLVEMLDLLSFEPANSEMIMGRFPPTELDDAAPELQRFLDSHKVKESELQGGGGIVRLADVHRSAASTTTGGGAGGSEGGEDDDSSSQHRSQRRAGRHAGVSTATIDGGDRRTAGVDLSQAQTRQEQQRSRQHRQLPGGFSANVPARIQFPVAFGENVAADPRRVNLPRRPFEVYSTRLNRARAGFANPDETSSVFSSASAGAGGLVGPGAPPDDGATSSVGGGGAASSTPLTESVVAQ